MQNHTSQKNCFARKAVYPVIAELPQVIFLNSNLLGKHRIFKKEVKTEELPDDCVHRFQRNMLERYLDQLSKSFKSDKYKVIISFVLQNFYQYIM